MTTLSEIANRIGLVAHSRDQSFSKLIKLAALDPAVDFRESNLSEVDFGELDVSGFDFSDADLTNADLSKVRNFNSANFTGATFHGTRLPTSARILPPTQAERAADLVVDELFDLVILPMALSQLVRVNLTNSTDLQVRSTGPSQYIYATPSLILVQLPSRLSWGADRLSKPVALWEIENGKKILEVPCILHDENRFDAGPSTAGNPSGRIYTGDLSIIGFVGLSTVDRLLNIQRHSHQTPDEFDKMCKRYFRYASHRAEVLRKESRYPLQVVTCLSPDDD